MTQPDDTSLDHIRQLGEELRAAFAAERTAISTLDHGKLTELAALKQRIAGELVAARDRVAPSAEVRALFVAIQIEARATAMLAAAATQAVRALLGQQPTGGYDRRARMVAAPQLRLLATY
jgi:hypothetical protein